MKAGQRLHEWASGVKLGAPGNGFRAHIEPRIKWKWCRIGASVMPWCPECGNVVAWDAGQRRHEENIHGSDELVVVVEPDGDEDQDEEHLSITGPVSQVVNPWQCALEEGHEGAHILSDPGWMRPANQCAEIAKGVPQR